MKTILSLFGILALSIVPLHAADDEKKAPADAAGTATAAAGARAIAEKLREDLGNAAAYKPTADQIAAITATAADAAKLTAYTDAIYAELKSGKAAAKPDQTEITVTGPDFKDLAGGYSQQREHFKPDVKIYGFKYIAPGKEFGMSFDGLFLVDGKWVFIPKAWRAFRE